MTLTQLKQAYYPTFTPDHRTAVRNLMKSGLDEGEAILTVAMQNMFKKKSEEAHAHS